jgi:hypothetical protein
MIEGVQIHIGKKLAGEVAERQALGALEGREQIVAGKIENFVVAPSGAEGCVLERLK